MSGDATLFARSDEVEEAWAFIDPIEEAWHANDAPELSFYPAGSWGPEAADNLLAREGRAWRRL
jgi:glucose-6-phosphate 1-dehydrogenase